MNRIKKGDKVIVLTGRSKGATGTVLSMELKSNRILVQGVNMVKRHTRQSQTSQGGIISQESPIHLSNVALVDPKDNKATKVGFRYEKDGTKVRYSKRSGAVIDG